MADADPTRGDTWAAAQGLVDQAPSLSGLRGHGLHLIAARVWRDAGRAVPDDLAHEELVAIWQVHVAEEILRTVAGVVDQDIIVVKGLAVARHYPDPALRPFADLDLLAVDPARAQRQLLDAGFRHVAGYPTGYFDGHHHLEPLELPGRDSVKIEIHTLAPWVHWCPPPTFDDLQRRVLSGPAPGVWFPDPLDHALILACHSWHSLPLRRALDLVDIALVSAGLDREQLARATRERRVSRLWRTTQAASDALLFGGAPPLPLRIWARDLKALRECSLLERHLRHWLAPFWVRAPHLAAIEARRALAVDLRPVGAERWPEKLRRIRTGVQHPLHPISDHDRRIGPVLRPLAPRDRRVTGRAKPPAPGASRSAMDDADR